MMKKWVKVLIIVIGVLVLIGSSAFGILKIQEYRKAEKERMEKEKIMMAYVRLNEAFLKTTGDSRDDGRFGRYISFSYPTEESNKYGINNTVYLILKMYESRTGKTLAYETVVEYFSQEFEPDGSLRLYNNGLHPEIAAYVEWAQGRRSEMIEYIREIDGIYAQYFLENRDRGFTVQSFSSLSPQMYDELAKKEADPSYELDLLSLQEQGY